MAKAASRRQPAKKKVPLEETARPFRNHYAGMHLGSCGSAQSAMVVAFKHLVYGEAGAATVVGPDNQDICRMHWTTMGPSIWAPVENRTSFYRRPKGMEVTKPVLHAKASAILRRVK